uniref:Protein BUD31 homolog n=1 Tax=Aegilops tauschii subsp. strangulata TaxID=200361 RepID=A0A453DTZ1_AEGTS
AAEDGRWRRRDSEPAGRATPTRPGVAYESTSPSAENDTHDRKRKCEALYPIFRISRSHYIYDLFYRRRKDISNELYVFCLDQGYADRNLIVKWKRSVASTLYHLS